ncbi:hypothetical protein HK104_009344 [Borealophlyctis nickersoniae]|nr:hypothetical protein HK104_009344 [Borealophlyctis nickersoniae]
MGFARLNEEEQMNLLPGLIRGIATRLPSQQMTLFHISLPILAKYKRRPPDPKASSSTTPASCDPFDFQAHPADLKYLLDKFLDIMLYTVPAAGKPLTPFTAGQNALSTQSPQMEELPVPPGLSKTALQQITNNGKVPWARNSAELKALKLGLVRLISISEAVPENLFVLERFKIYVVASSDSNHEIVSAGEDGLKRHAKPDLEDPQVVRSMYSLYQGVTQPTNPDATRSAATTSLKGRVINFLLRSARATSQFPHMLQVAFDALYGETTTPKLRAAGMSFVQWIARMANDTAIQPIAPVLLSGLLKYINEHEHETGQEEESLRGYAYEGVGLLSKRAPELFRNDVSILFSFFKAVSTEQRNVRVSVQEALSTMIEAYKDIGQDAEKQKEMEEVLMANLNKPEQQARYVAVKYSNAIFPFTYPLARYICLTACGDPNLEVREEARRGLTFPDAPAPSASPEEESLAISRYRSSIPDFGDMASLLRDMSRKPRPNQVKAPGMRFVGGFTAEAYTHSLEFLRKVLILSADPPAVIDDLSGVSDEKTGISDPNTRERVRALLQEMWKDEGKTNGNDSMELDDMKASGGGLRLYIELIETALKAGDADALLQSVAATCLYELISLCPSTMSRSYSDRIEWIKSFLSSVKIETRLAMAHVLAIVASSELGEAGRAEAFKKLVEDLMIVVKDTSKQTTLEMRHGALFALGCLMGRLMYRFPYNFEEFVPSALVGKAVSYIADELGASSSIIVAGACQALAEAGRYATLPLDEGAGNWTGTKIAEKLIALGKVSKDSKVQESALTALGHLALGTPTLRVSIMAFFYTLPAILTKQAEVHFTIGEAICAATCGFASTHMEEYLDIADAVYPPDSIEVPDGKQRVGNPSGDFVDKVLKKMMDELKPGGRPVVRKGVCVWLLCFVKFCGKHPNVAANAFGIHEAFSGLLADRDDFTQEVASKGTGLVYEIGDQATREALVASLVSTFTEGRKLAPQSVTADTQLFADNALGAAPDGGSITTYQSILSLASDMNQPDLVYRFMSLASHNAVWNSRRGASMGFGSIAAQAERELRPHLHKMVPRLYRFQFDPNQRVAESMKSIWKSLVKEPKKSVDEFFDVIMSDLLKAMGDRQWRTREASCHAVADLIHGRQISELEPYLQELWTMCFRVLDDIKESVRLAAFSTCKALTKVTVRYCDPSTVGVSEGQKVMNTVLPFFLTKGLGSMAEDVRKFSLSTILKICKKGGVLLRPHLPELVGTLLESLSSLEPQVMNYLSFHTERYNISQEQLDSSRLSATKMSPMMDAIETCIQEVDASGLEPIVSRVNTLIRKGVGLPTKAGCARLVCSLVQRMPQDLRPHADSILKALSGAVYDRSPVVRKANATAIGHICRIASEGAMSRLLNHLQSSYLEGDDEDKRSVTPITILEISRHANDVLKGHLGQVLPLAYVGARDPVEALKTVWVEVWEDNTAGASGAVKLWLPELMSTVEGLLTSTPSWAVKRQVAQSIGDIAKAIGSSFEDQMEKAVKLLTEALTGRTWDGKEAVIEALGVVCVEGKNWFNGPGSEKVDDITKVMIREAKKNSKPYRRVALEHLGKVFDALKLDRYEEIHTYLVDTATAQEDPDDMDVDEPRDKPLALQIKANAFKSLGLCFPRVYETQAKYANDLLQLLAQNADGNVWNVRLAVLETLGRVIDKLALDESEDLLEVATVQLVIAGLLKALHEGKYTAIREASAEVLKKFILRVKGKSECFVRCSPESKSSVRLTGLHCFLGTKLFTEAVKSQTLTGVDEVISKELVPAVEEKLKETRREVSGMDIS